MTEERKKTKNKKKEKHIKKALETRQKNNILDPIFFLKLFGSFSTSVVLL